MLTTPRRYWETTRHLSASQILDRLRLRACGKCRQLVPGVARALYDGRVNRADVRWPVANGGPDLARLRLATSPNGMLHGAFCFLNQEAHLGWPPDWRAPNQSVLWRFQLHYFDYLLELLGSDASRDEGLRVMADWVRRVPMHSRGVLADAWHPYVVSHRVMNWILALSARPGPSPPAEIRHSLLTQALFLSRNLETDVKGNHLLKNLQALVYAGAFWRGTTGDRWVDRFGSQFARELARQTLPDGGHYERSPMYHALVLVDALEVLLVLRSLGHRAWQKLEPLVRQQAEFLGDVIHPDGEIALFNDSVIAHAPPPLAICNAVSRAFGTPAGATTARLELVLALFGGADVGSCRELPRRPAAVRSRPRFSTGYVALPPGNPNRFLIADVGAVCPADLPAHAHCDLLSFELSVAQRRIIVDAGVSEYAPGPWRDYYRSTRAHNTVSVDGEEQSDCWGSFRVGRRARPGRVTCRSWGHGLVLDAGHDGFGRLAGHPQHRRRFFWSESDFWIVADSLDGFGRHRWTSFCHLHPDATVVAETPSAIRVRRETALVDICWFGFARLETVIGRRRPLQGWYAERFGESKPAVALLFEAEGVLPASFGFAVVPVGEPGRPLGRAVQYGERIEVDRGDGTPHVIVLESTGPLWCESPI